jgi:histidinol-phosphate aminotransferase
MSKLWSPLVHQLQPYVPGEQPKSANLTKLNTNENPYGPSPKVLEALRQQADESLKLYPDPNSDALRQAIADYYQLQSHQVFVGNGSDEVLAHVFQAFFKQAKPILFPDITYSFYPVYCGLYQIEYRTLPLNQQFEICIDDYLQDNGGIIFPNPNAPTGVYLPLAEIERLLQHHQHSVVVVDEAYCDFGGASAASLIQQYPQLLVVSTLSKSRSLAGLRVGFALGHADLIEALHRIKDSFNSYPLDRFAQAGAVAAFQDQAYFEMTRERVIASRQWLVQQLQALGFQVLPSQANFIFAQHPQHSAALLNEQLRAHEIIVRRFAQPERISNFLRITIGDQQQCEKLVETLAKLLKLL